MIAYNVNEVQMDLALRRVNKRYEDNIIWNRYEVKGEQIHFTLKVNSSKKPGHTVGVGYAMGLDWAKKRRLPYACWHVHGYFFEALFEINPAAIIKSGRTGLITIDEGNWEDYERGSVMLPAKASECCDCNAEETLPREVARIRTFRRKIRS